MRHIILLVLGLFVVSLANGQLPQSQSSEFSHFNKGVQLFKQGIYEKSIDEFQTFRSQEANIDHTSLDRHRIQAEYYIALGSIKLGLPEAEQLFLDFVQNHKPDPLIFMATLEIADYYYNQRKYDEAYTYYGQIRMGDIPPSKREEILFKKGYVLFTQGNYQQARSQLNLISNTQGPNYYPSNYYIAMSYYEQGIYDKALPYFEKIESSRKYGRFIPAYKSQILFELNQFDEVIDYAPGKLEEDRVQEKDKIAYVLALSYIQREKYDLALPHLESYSRRNRMTSDDHYQLAYVQYKTGRYEEAIATFSKISDENNKRGQNANLYLADAYLKLDDKESARNAFANASRRGDDESVALEASFNYGKLSAEMGFDREAVNALSKVPPSSDYHKEAQEILSDVFLKTRDYEKAIATIESIDEPSSELLSAYQKITFYRAIQYFRENEFDLALESLEKSLDNPIEQNWVAQATFWKADILSRQQKYDESTSLLLSYKDQAKNLSNLPAGSSPYMANYILGYNYIKQNKYGQAETYFKQAVQGIKTNRVNIKNRYVTDNIYGDALLRHGDCLFKLNKYDAAISAYDQTIERKSSGFVYALFQKSIIYGLQGQRERKVESLNSLVDNYPNSTYTDNALLELGSTLTELGRLNQAIKPLNKLVTDYATTSELVVDALLRLGLLSYNLGDTKTALNYYKAVFDKNPQPEQSSEALNSIEEIYVQDMGQPEAYVKFLEEKSGVSLGQQSKDSLNFRAAEAQFENCNYERAAQAYKRYLEQFPSGIHALSASFRMGESYLAEGQYEDALVGYERVIKRGPSPYYAPACQKAAIISYNHTEDFEKSTEYFQRWSKVAQSEEDELTAQVGGMEAAYRSNNVKAVLDLSDQVFQNPRSTDDQKGKAMYYRGKVALEEEQWEQALKAFNEVSRLSDDERTAEARYQIARIYYLQNELELAEKLSRESYKESSAYPFWVAKSLILLSDILVKQDDVFNAKAALEAVIENFGESEEILAEANTKLDKIKELEDE
jgi:tetratricopeptide (TPR) repeat protein